MALLFEWANDRETRKQSFSEKQITWEEHKKWYANSLKNPKRKLYIGYVDNMPIGMFRVDNVEKDEWEISYSIAKNVRGQGLGTVLIKTGEEKVQQEIPSAVRLTASVKETNMASKKIFEKLNYKAMKQDDVVIYRKDIRG